MKKIRFALCIAILCGLNASAQTLNAVNFSAPPEEQVEIPDMPPRRTVYA